MIENAMTAPRAGVAAKQPEWYQQWSMFEDSDEFLFLDWIQPNTLAVFAGQHVLEGGCGGGQHTAMVAPVAASVTSVDLNTVEIARQRNAKLKNVEFIEADIASMDLGRQFDVVICIGVIHHTDEPDSTFRNLYRHCRPGGRIIVWVYSAEGNALVRFCVEPVRRHCLRRLPRRHVVALAYVLTAVLYTLIHSVYRLKFLRFLPYHAYFCNARRLSFRRNVLNVFDKLNAPQTTFISRARCEQWFHPSLFLAESISIRSYAGVSYCLSGIKRNGPALEQSS